MDANEPVKSMPARTTPARGQTDMGEEAGAQGVGQLSQGDTSRWQSRVPEEEPEINGAEGT